MSPVNEASPAPDAERDAWLRAALRHAPDAQTGPPPALSEAILHAARARAREALPARSPRPGLLDRARTAWRRLGSPAAAMAGTLTVMVLATVLWRQGPADVAGDPAPRTASGKQPSVASLPAPAPAPAAAPAQMPVPHPPSAQGQAKREHEQGEAAALADAAPGRLRRAEAPAPTAEKSAADRSARRAAVPAEPASVLQPAPALAALRQDLLDAPARWTWRTGSAAARPVGPALLDWLGRLDKAATSRWTPAATASDTLSGTTVQLLLDGRLAHRLRLEGSTVRWEAMPVPGADAGRWQAIVGDAESAALREGLRRAVR